MRILNDKWWGSDGENEESSSRDLQHLVGGGEHVGSSIIEADWLEEKSSAISSELIKLYIRLNHGYVQISDLGCSIFGGQSRKT